jgi:hypothetical protein
MAVHSELILPSLHCNSTGIDASKMRKVKSNNEQLAVKPAPVNLTLKDLSSNKEEAYSSLFRTNAKKTNNKVLPPRKNGCRDQLRGSDAISEDKSTFPQFISQEAAKRDELPKLIDSNSLLASSRRNKKKIKKDSFILQGTGINNAAANGCRKINDFNITESLNFRENSSAHLGNKQNNTSLYQPSLKLKLPANIQKCQMGADCCSIINLSMPLPSTDVPSKSKSFLGDSQELMPPNEARNSKVLKNSLKHAKADHQESKLPEAPWQKRNNNNSRKLGDSQDHLTTALLQLKKVASAGQATYNNPIVTDSDLFSTKDKEKNIQLNTVNFDKQASSLPAPMSHTVPITLAALCNEAHSSPPLVNGNSLGELPPPNSPQVLHRISILASLDKITKKETKSSKKHSHLKGNISQRKKIHGKTNDESHLWKQLPSSSVPNHLFSKRNSLNNNPTTNGDSITPLHHSLALDLSVEGNTTADGPTTSTKDINKLSKRGSLSKKTLPPLDKATSLQITPVKMHDFMPRLSSGISLHSHRKQRQLQTNVSSGIDTKDTSCIDIDHTSYLDPFRGASNQYQWRINRLYDRQDFTKRVEKKIVKKH